MKVYVYKKKDRHKRHETIENANVISKTEKEFCVVTSDGELLKYNNEEFMLSVYGY